jgi:hypothetical protein
MNVFQTPPLFTTVCRIFRFSRRYSLGQLVANSCRKFPCKWSRKRVYTTYHISHSLLSQASLAFITISRLRRRTGTQAALQVQACVLSGSEHLRGMGVCFSTTPHTYAVNFVKSHRINHTYCAHRWHMRPATFPQPAARQKPRWRLPTHHDVIAISSHHSPASLKVITDHHHPDRPCVCIRR